ncbi:unnamed protein product, partial [marine sediment metagenome]
QPNINIGEYAGKNLKEKNWPEFRSQNKKSVLMR